tara:strand:+ start:174 stop:590 length:417 start_codon:yes stop_codon:yes gene_type:complete
MRVEIYLNLHKTKKEGSAVYSVRSMETRRVIKHIKGNVIMNNVQFIVSKAGRDRVLKEQRKNVHAFIRGELVGCRRSNEPFPILPGGIVTYNPYKYDSFVCTTTKKPIYKSRKIYIDKTGHVFYEKQFSKKLVNYEAS